MPRIVLALMLLLTGLTGTAPPAAACSGVEVAVHEDACGRWAAVSVFGDAHGFARAH